MCDLPRKDAYLSQEDGVNFLGVSAADLHLISDNEQMTVELGQASHVGRAMFFRIVC